MAVCVTPLTVAQGMVYNQVCCAHQMAHTASCVFLHNRLADLPTETAAVLTYYLVILGTQLLV